MNESKGIDVAIAISVPYFLRKKMRATRNWEALKDINYGSATYTTIAFRLEQRTQ